jgi:hypothetical protein
MSPLSHVHAGMPIGSRDNGCLRVFVSSCAHEEIEVIRYRYWLAKRGESTLQPFGQHDRTKWTRETVAQCRHDSSHIPPHLDCTCGLYAMTLLDVLYAIRARGWLNELMAWNDFTVQYGGMAGYALFGRKAAREWLNSLPVAVIGEVDLADAIESITTQPSGHEARAWRARTATMRRLYVPEGEHDLADALSAAYGVPCTVGYPTAYSQSDWDERRSSAGCRISTAHDYVWPDFEELGLYPPE